MDEEGGGEGEVEWIQFQLDSHNKAIVSPVGLEIVGTS